MQQSAKFEMDIYYKNLNDCLYSLPTNHYVLYFVHIIMYVYKSQILKLSCTISYYRREIH